MPDPVDTDERLYDAYLDAALRGELEDPDEFCARHGRQNSPLRSWLAGVRDLVGIDCATADLPFETLGEYRLLQRLGEGGMGIVYVAEHVGLGRHAAVKVLRPEFATSPSAIERLGREARAIAKLRHPNIVTIYEFGEQDGVHFLAMELVPGESLDAKIAAAKESGLRLPVRDVLAWIAELADALATAHDQGVLHRDVKPSNVRINPRGRAILLDFGLARDIESTAPTLTSSFAGSPAYCSPEQLSGERDRVSPASDQYSLAVTAYESLTNATPHDARSVEQLLHQIMAGAVRPLRQLEGSLPRDLETVVMKALERTPSRRYDDIADFGADIQAVSELRPIRARPPGAPARLAKWARRNRLAATSLIGSLAIIAAVTITLAWNHASNLAEARSTASELVAEAHERINAMIARRFAASRTVERLDALQHASRRRWLDDDENRDLLRCQTELERHFGEHEAALASIVELMARARRFDPDSAAIDEVWARFYYERWFSHHASKDNTKTAQLFRQTVTRFDRTGEWTDHVHGNTPLTIESDPPGARVYLWRLRRLADVRDDSYSRRLVPAPIEGPPRLCGRLALRVRQSSGTLERGDLVFRIAGRDVDALPEHTPPPPDTPVTLLRGTDVLEVSISEPPDWRATAAPHDLREALDLGTAPIAPRPIASGDYVAMLRLDGYADLITPIHIHHYTGDEPSLAALRLRLVPVASDPPGFARITHPNSGRDFFMFEREVTCGEYLEFLNDPNTLAEVDAATSLIRVPRQLQSLSRGGDWPRQSDGRYAMPDGTPSHEPVLGVSWNDARAYTLWLRRTRGDWKIDERPYKYGFPTPEEWRAAGSGYGMGRARRRYSFGDHWHARDAKSRFASLRSAAEPVLSYPVDESPYGVFDMAGSAAEWCELFIDAGKQQRGLAGGSWLESDPSAFLLTRFRPADPTAVSREYGFRIVLRPRRRSR